MRREARDIERENSDKAKDKARNEMYKSSRVEPVAEAAELAEAAMAAEAVVAAMAAALAAAMARRWRACV